MWDRSATSRNIHNKQHHSRLHATSANMMMAMMLEPKRRCSACAIFCQSTRPQVPPYNLLDVGRGVCLTEFSNYAKLCTFCRMGLHSSKRYFFLREVSTAHTCAGGEHTHRAFHIRYYIITAGHGRRPAIRVSERVCPTADLAPSL